MPNIMMKRVHSTLRRFVFNQRGVAAIEFALIFPAMALMYFGMLDLTYFITVNRKVTAASSVIADLVTTNKDKVTADSVDDYFYAGYQMIQPSPETALNVDLYNFQADTTIVDGAKLRWSKFNRAAASCGEEPSAANVKDLVTKGNDLLVTRVCFTYTPMFGSFMGKKLLGNTAITLTKNIYERPRLSDKLVLE